MDAAIFLIIILIGFLRFFEVFLFDRKKTEGKIRHGWTLRVLSVNYVLLLVSAVAEYFIVGRQLNIYISAAAIGVLIARFLIKYKAFRTLGEFYSSEIEIRNEHKLIRSGLYRHIRHPAYLSNLLDFIAVPLLANSFFTIAWSFPVQIVLLQIRIRLEEKELIKKFGKEYAEYKKQTGSLIPLFIPRERNKDEDTADSAAV